jgi:hypothetical protein
MYILSTILGPHLNILGPAIGPAPFTNLAPPLLITVSMNTESCMIRLAVVGLQYVRLLNHEY